MYIDETAQGCMRILDIPYGENDPRCLMGSQFHVNA